MTEIWNLSALCRCCHADGDFKSLQMPYRHGGTMEVYSNMLRECLGISIVQPSIEASFSICDVCIEKLRDSNNFRKQVLECEQKFHIYCQNETANNVNVAIKLEPDDNEYKDDHKVTIEIDTKCDPVDNDPGQSYNSDCKEDCMDYDDEEPNYQEIKIEPESKVKSEDDDTKDTKKKFKTTAKGVKTKTKVRTRRNTDKHYICAVCNAVFKKMIEMDTHVKDKHQPPIACTECFKEYKDYPEFKQHVKDGCRRIFTCKFCGKTYRTYSAMQVHENSVHLNKSYYQCDMCGKNFGYKGTLRKHILYHLGMQKTCVCDLCGRGFNDRTNLNIHIMGVHQKIKRFACDRCDKKFTLKKHLLKHFIRHDGIKTERCPHCLRSFFDKEDLRYHIRTVHGIEPGVVASDKVIGPEKVYKCSVCQNIFGTRAQYMRHLKKHRDDGALPFTCEICGKNFKGRYVLNRHISSHTSTEMKFRFPCPICEKRFTTKACMERHAKIIHDPERDNCERVKCPICKLDVKDLNRHQKRHNVRPYACTLCPKAYPEKNALNRHVKLTHLAIRLHPCQLCSKEYTRADVLKKHMERKHYNEQGPVKVEHEVENCSY